MEKRTSEWKLVAVGLTITILTMIGLIFVGRALHRSGLKTADDCPVICGDRVYRVNYNRYGRFEGCTCSSGKEYLR